MTLAFACINVGADFGDRAPSGAFIPEGLDAASENAGTRILNDVHGLMTYEDGPGFFIRIGPITAQQSSPHQRLADALDRASTVEATLTSSKCLAYDLYAASFFADNADARFVLLMMALETLLEPQRRSDDAQALIDRLVAATRESNLLRDEVASIEGALSWLRQESITRTGRRLVAGLGDRTYRGEDPETFFMQCYRLRSRLVHGHDPRPGRTEIDGQAADLERFVSDLIAGSLLEGP